LPGSLRRSNGRPDARSGGPFCDDSPSYRGGIKNGRTSVLADRRTKAQGDRTKPDVAILRSRCVRKRVLASPVVRGKNASRRPKGSHRSKSEAAPTASGDAGGDEQTLHPRRLKRARSAKSQTY